MFKFIKFLGIMSVGMLFSPKKGIELRKDLVDYLNKYKPQLKKLIITLEESWERAKSSESDETSLAIETKLTNIREAADELDAAKTKELAYKALTKLGTNSIKVGKGVIKSPNFISVAKDIALITVNALDTASSVYSKVKDVSTSFVEDTNTESEVTKVTKVIKEDDKKTKIVSTKTVTEVNEKSSSKELKE